MKLCRFGAPGAEQPGIVTESGQRRDTTAFGEDYGERFFATEGIERLRTWLVTHQERCAVVDESVRWGPPIARPSKIVCIGLNYAGHAAEAGARIPKEPMVFMKSTSAFCGPYDDIVIPRGSSKLDWEVELAFVIGRAARYVAAADAYPHIVGYVLFNDVSERAFQLERSGQWVKGKSADTFAPTGPYFVTADEIPDPHALAIWLKVNDELMQSSNTGHLVCGVDRLLEMLSGYFTLLPGDIVATGTPDGVGLGRKPPRYLQAGDVVELGVEGLGVARQRVTD